MKPLLIIIILIIVAGALFLFTGLYNVAADRKSFPLIEGALEIISSQSVSLHSNSITVPSLKDSASYIVGFGYYVFNCIICHGAPGINRSSISQGLNPEPPSLVESDIAPLPKKVFWIVKHGIQMTGMPSFGKTTSDKELWNIVAFINRMHTLKESDFKALQKKP
jgi:hypothetical protein